MTSRFGAASSPATVSPTPSGSSSIYSANRGPETEVPPWFIPFLLLPSFVPLLLQFLQSQTSFLTPYFHWFFLLISPHISPVASPPMPSLSTPSPLPRLPLASSTVKRRLEHLTIYVTLDLHLIIIRPSHFLAVTPHLAPLSTSPFPLPPLSFVILSLTDLFCCP